MAEIQIARIDYRLIHGQVVTKWMKAYPAKRIVIVDSELAQDDFMADIYMMAAPAGTKVDVVETERARSFLDSISGSVFLLFKNVESCYEAFFNGVAFPRLVVGGIPTDAGKVLVYSSIYMSASEYDKLEQISRAGIEVILQSTPDDSCAELSKIKEKL
ncbi:PTS sugar transporter subunit IIB [Anaerostipes sp.]|uniref:PTS sugar transporter subunit IIB n=1 Tax=Anaerostipes sp. TaxID=1872530 RepID=UPI0025C47F12|nr:PTS sugar transporter subunit IIB [Anaerostipes sp.]MBS7009008.1 PTS sugar transporter subunit IIB [Anaerostipes sp.]